MDLARLIFNLKGSIRDFFLFMKPGEEAIAAKQISDFFKDLESQDPSPFDKKTLHDAVNGFNKALTSK